MTTRSDDRSIISENLKYILISFFEKIRGQNLICQKKKQTENRTYFTTASEIFNEKKGTTSFTNTSSMKVNLLSQL